MKIYGIDQVEPSAFEKDSAEWKKTKIVFAGFA